MKAKARYDAVVIMQEYVIEGDHILHVRCEGYNDFARLPQAVEFQGKLFGKSGWNSDNNEAFYKDSLTVAVAA